MHRKWGLYIFLVIILLLLLSPLATIIRREPTLAVAVKTWSMEPVITRGISSFCCRSVIKPIILPVR